MNDFKGLAWLGIQHHMGTRGIVLTDQKVHVEGLHFVELRLMLKEIITV